MNRDLSLYVLQGPHLGETFAIKDRLACIGNAVWCDLSLSKDNLVSSAHCECLSTPQGLLIRTLRGEPSVKIDHVSVFEGYLPINSSLSLGQSKLELRASSQPKQLVAHPIVSLEKPRSPTSEDFASVFPLREQTPPLSLKEFLHQTERVLIEQALVESQHKISIAAALLSLSDSWLYSRVKHHKLSKRNRGFSPK